MDHLQTASKNDIGGCPKPRWRVPTLHTRSILALVRLAPVGSRFYVHVILPGHTPSPSDRGTLQFVIILKTIQSLANEIGAKRPSGSW